MVSTIVDDSKERSEEQPKVGAFRTFLWNEQLFVLLVLSIQATLLLYRAKIESFVWDEVAHLAAGISHIENADFSLYRVNPPLVRSVAAIPLLFVKKEYDWSSYSDEPAARAEFLVGADFVKANGARSFDLLQLSRWSVLWAVPIGGLFAWRWSRELFGRRGGIVTLVLWAFSPALLANGSLITPDASAAAFALIAMYYVKHWISCEKNWAAMRAGGALGLCLLVKNTLLLLLPTVFLLIFMRLLISSFTQTEFDSASSKGKKICLLGQSIFVTMLALFVLNLGYEFQGTFRTLDSYEFTSRALNGITSPIDRSQPVTGNRFRGTAIGHFPVPFPKDWVLGIDIQKWDFECRPWSFLAGKWSRDGWWYYYVFGMALKEPIGALFLIGLAVSLTLSSHLKGIFRCHNFDFETALDLTTLLLPSGLILLVVSSHTGMNHHIRYVLPVLPFLYVLSGLAGKTMSSIGMLGNSCLFLILASVISSSMSVYPHSIAYFNELVGPAKGSQYLTGSNIDWGQDLRLLGHWLKSNPEKKPQFLAYSLPLVNPALAGVYGEPMPKNGDILNSDEGSDRILVPGRHIISVSRLRSESEPYSWIELLKPDYQIGWSILIYDIDPNEVEMILKELKVESH